MIASTFHALSAIAERANPYIQSPYVTGSQPFCDKTTNPKQHASSRHISNNNILPVASIPNITTTDQHIVPGSNTTNASSSTVPVGGSGGANASGGTTGVTTAAAAAAAAGSPTLTSDRATSLTNQSFGTSSPYQSTTTSTQQQQQQPHSAFARLSNHQHHPNMTAAYVHADDVQKLIYPTYVPIVSGNGIESVVTEHFTLVCLQPPTGLKLILVAAPTYLYHKKTLQQVYCLYVDYVLKNPFYTLGMPIRNELFEQKLDLCIAAAIKAATNAK